MDESELFGYTRLLRVETKTGDHMGRLSLFVPKALGRSINECRERLSDDHDNPAAWAAACVPQPPVPPALVAAQAEVARLNDQRKAAAAKVEPAHAAPRARPKRPRDGRLVRVIAASEIQARRHALGFRGKTSNYERQDALKMLDRIEGLGEQRLVGLNRDWRSLLAQMASDMPHFSGVIERISACCALAEFTRRPLSVPPLLLAGPPGVGKTHFARRLSLVLGSPQFLYALEAAETTAALLGSEKHWAESEPGALFNLVVLGTHANPVIVLDEVDKVSNAMRYKPAEALLSVLERSTSRQLRDKAADLVFDASHIVYVGTCNQLSTISEPLLSRFELFHVAEPGPRESVAIARSIGRQSVAELGLAGRVEVPAGEVVQQLALLGNPRRMHKLLKAALARVVVAGRTRLTVEDLGAALRVPGAGTTPSAGRDSQLH